MSSHRNQIVITGAGLVTPLGIGREETWHAILESRRGMGPMSAMESALPPSAEGGQAPDLPREFHPSLQREARYLRHAIDEALGDAGIDGQIPYGSDRRGIILGTTIHGMRSAGRFLRSGDHTFFKDFLSGSVLSGAASDLDFGGCAMTTCSACSSSLGSIALAVTLLRAGDLDLIVAGGYDTISEYVYGGFNSLRLVAPGPLRPFARGRQGMKLAEGYGIVVLERAQDAERRLKRPLARILGFGESADAHHLTQPHPQGEGAARAIQRALDDAGIAPAQVDLIAAHATGTPDNDAGEFAAFSRVFGPQLASVPTVAFKSHLGHTLGGAGAVELVLSAMALRDQVIPACANVTPDDLEFTGLNLATGTPRKSAIHTTLNTSLGFGGANTCVILGSEPCGPPTANYGQQAGNVSRGWSSQCSTAASGCVQPKTPAREVLITGIGVVLPGVTGREAFSQRLSESPTPLLLDPGPVPESQIAGLLNARRVRRMSDYVKLSLASAVLALRDAGIEDAPAFCETAAAILGTTHGSSEYCEEYYRQIVEEGIGAANPMLFAEGVPNAAAAHLSLMLGVKGPCQTLIGSRTAGLDALRLAAARIGAGEWDRAIVGAAEGYSPTVNAAYARWGLYGDTGFRAGAGAVTFVVESRRSMESHGGHAHGSVLDAAGSTARPSQTPRLLRRIIERFGRPAAIINSANHTWIDRAERMGIHTSAVPAWSPYGSIGECFSVLPLAGIAAALLGAALCADRFASVATDYSGAVSGVLIGPTRPAAVAPAVALSDQRPAGKVMGTPTSASAAPGIKEPTRTSAFHHGPGPGQKKFRDRRLRRRPRPWCAAP